VIKPLCPTIKKDQNTKNDHFLNQKALGFQKASQKHPSNVRLCNFFNYLLLHINTFIKTTTLLL